MKTVKNLKSAIKALKKFRADSENTDSHNEQMRIQIVRSTHWGTVAECIRNLEAALSDAQNGN